MSRKNILNSERDLLTVAGRIGRVRDISGLSLENFGEKIGRSKSNVSAYEHGRSRPDFDATVLLTELFDVPCEWLLHGRGEYPPKVPCPDAGNKEPCVATDTEKILLKQGEDLRALTNDVHALKDELKGIRADLKRLLGESAKGHHPRVGAEAKEPVGK